MRLLPCGTPSCAGKGALLPASATYPKGEPYLAASHVHRVQCARCKRTTEVSLLDFNRLPRLSLEELETLVPGRALNDVKGAGFDEKQAADLFRAGLQDSTALHVLDRGQESERQEQEALAAGLVDVLEPCHDLPCDRADKLRPDGKPSHAHPSGRHRHHVRRTTA